MDTHIPQYLENELPDEARTIFIEAVNKSERCGCSLTQRYMSGFAAVERAGYKRGADGKFHCEQSYTIKMQSVHKSDAEKRQVFGFFNVVEVNGVPVVDSQGDVISSTDLEESVYKYMKFSRMGDERHDGRCKATLIESMYFSKEKQAALGIDLGFVGWWGGFEIHDSAMWEKVKNGEYQSFSIGGTGRREQLS